VFDGEGEIGWFDEMHMACNPDHGFWLNDLSLCLPSGWAVYSLKLSSFTSSLSLSWFAIRSASLSLVVSPSLSTHIRTISYVEAPEQCPEKSGLRLGLGIIVLFHLILGEG
jgi:hypothetical protein